MKLTIHKSKFQFLLLLATISLFISCGSPFVVEQTTYNKMVVTESSNTEVIKVTVNDVEEGVEFQKIVFNRTESDVSVKDLGNGSYEITTKQENGSPVIISNDSEGVNKSNRLIYTKDGKEFFYQLSDIDFLPTKIRGNSAGKSN